MAREVALALDARTGAILVEDTHALPLELRDMLERLAGPPQAIACAAPPAVLALSPASPEELATQPCVRLAGYWHDSLIEGPGRRSVAKLQGCPLRCRGCIAPDSWDAAGGFSLPFLLAVGLLDGAVLEQVRHERIHDPRVRALSARAARRAGRAGERNRPVEGRRALTGQASGSVRLESRGEIEAKFHDNAQRTLSAQRAGELMRLAAG